MIFSPGKILPARIASRNCTARFSFSSPRDSELTSGELFSTLITVNCTMSHYALLTVGVIRDPRAVVQHPGIRQSRGLAVRDCQKQFWHGDQRRRLSCSR